MRTAQIAYTLTEMSEGYVARCVTNSFATAYGRTEDEAGENLVDAIRTYIRMCPDQADSMLRPPPTKDLVLDDTGPEA